MTRSRYTGIAKWFFKAENVDSFYDIGEELGRGSFAVVKKGIRKSDGAVFAFKFIDRTALKGDDEAMLQSECAVLKEVHHPNIVRLFEIYSAADTLVLVMEFVDAGEMLEKLKVQERYCEADAANTVERIAVALKYIHAKGIAHRDLKPENLLLTHTGEVVKIADFGFAKLMSEEHQMLQTACGTPEYVAPEVLQQRGYDVECDIWSLGVVLYVMLCGRPPFWSRNQRKLFDLIQHEPVHFRSDYGWDGVSAQAKDLILQMLEKDPRKRMNSDQVLAHPWLQRKDTYTNDLSGASRANLRAYLAGTLDD
jgi:serine/threonine protein kinase